MAFEGSIYLWELVRSAARMPCGQHFRCHSAGSIPIEELRKSETTPAMRSEREREREILGKGEQTARLPASILMTTAVLSGTEYHVHSTAFSTCDSGETVSDDQRLREVSQSHYPVSLFFCCCYDVSC